jgi:hypothetical protein
VHFPVPTGRVHINKPITLWHEDTFVDFETGLNTRSSVCAKHSAIPPTILPSSRLFPGGVTNSWHWLKYRSAKTARWAVPLTGRKHSEGGTF